MFTHTLIEKEENELPRQAGQLGIVVMRGCEDIGHTVNNCIKEWRGSDADFLVPCKCPRFLTGEAKGLIRHTVRGYDIYIITDCFNNSVTYNMHQDTNRMSPDDHYADLKRIIAALGGKAARINVIMPMLYEGRQHRRLARESLDCALALQELVAMGVSNIITFDAHDPRVQNAIPLSGFDTVNPTYQMVKALYENVEDIDMSYDKTAIISPDEGAMSRCLFYSSVFGLDVGMFYKRRDYSKVENGRNPIVAFEYLGNDIDGKDVIIVDDMLASGDSLMETARQLKERKAKRVFAFVTFGLYCEGFDSIDRAYENGYINKIFTTNAVYQPNEINEKPWHCSVNISRYIARIIDTLNYDGSLSDLLSPTERMLDLKKLYETIKVEKNNRSE